MLSVIRNTNLVARGLLGGINIAVRHLTRLLEHLLDGSRTLRGVGVGTYRLHWFQLLYVRGSGPHTTDGFVADRLADLVLSHGLLR